MTGPGLQTVGAYTIKGNFESGAIEGEAEILINDVLTYRGMCSKSTPSGLGRHFVSEEHGGGYIEGIWDTLESVTGTYYRPDGTTEKVKIVDGKPVD